MSFCHVIRNISFVAINFIFMYDIFMDITVDNIIGDTVWQLITENSLPVSVLSCDEKNVSQTLRLALCEGNARFLTSSPL